MSLFLSSFRVMGLVFALATLSFAATMPKGFAEKRVANGLSSPSALTIARDGRVFIAQQQGQVRLLKNDTLLVKPFLALTNIDGSQERGLLGITLDPGFDTNHYVYVYYTALQPTLHNRLSRFTARGDTADFSSDTVLLDLPTLPFRQGTTPAYWHMGGGIEFGPDGKLYIGVGDHENPNAASNFGLPFGKILRLNADGSPPADNPYVDSTGLTRYIYARGFRNPFSIAIQKTTGRVFANDVGEGSWESVDSVTRGGHHGWRTYEGVSGVPGFVDPLQAYSHSGGTDYTGCAIIGGDFYHPDSLRFAVADTGYYFYTDFCEGWIRKVHPRTGVSKQFATGLSYPTGMKFDREGNLYYLSRDYQTGGIQAGASSAWKITGGQDTTPIALTRAPWAARAKGPGTLRHALPGERWLVPQGATRLRVRDLSGRLLWEGRALVPGARIEVPAAAADRIVFARWD